MEHHKPKAFLLENVKNLKSHDKGRTWKIIEKTLVELGYNVHSKVINSSLVVPQRRERVFIVGFREETDFEFPDIKPTNRKLTTRLFSNRKIYANRSSMELSQGLQGKAQKS